jgi:ubiquinone/menaquinone biosynthesis C-methylase UbiE
MDTKSTAIDGADASEVKTCCAAAYQSDWAKLILGDSFHPGGMALTERLGHLLHLAPGVRVLDVAAGKGTSAVFLAKQFGCEVVGVDYGGDSIREATAAAAAAGVEHLTRFEQGDAERLPVADGTFDAIICECAFCTFPDKPTAATEFQRVLRPGGMVGLSDLTHRGDAIPPDLQGLLAWVACIADAQPIDEYARYLTTAGLRVDLVEPHDEALDEMVQGIRTKLLGAELLVKLKRVELPGADFEQARTVARAAAQAVKDGLFGYAILTATKPD